MTYPTLTEKPDQSTYYYTQEDPAIKSDMEGGYVTSRPRFLRNPRKTFYFGYKTLERAYLLKTDEGEPVERPQYLLMRVALGIHCGRPVEDDAVGAAASAGDDDASAQRIKEE